MYASQYGQKKTEVNGFLSSNPLSSLDQAHQCSLAQMLRHRDMCTVCTVHCRRIRVGKRWAKWLFMATKFVLHSSILIFQIIELGWFWEHKIFNIFNCSNQFKCYRFVELSQTETALVWKQIVSISYASALVKNWMTEKYF